MEQAVQYIITGYLAVMSLIGFTIMGVDKRRAVKKAWRIPERTLFLAAFLGGGIGSVFGMFAFHHKTKHIKFVILLPLAAVFYLYVLIKLYHLV